ncbi:hypothetical protein [Lentzea terrae]|uniref:hypothetical protein n=1 Tax=Lentzea terrae TaxID=2200761 RepID=UPI0013001E03|nr:hypothetical protein [Lentzea terrae]
MSEVRKFLDEADGTPGGPSNFSARMLPLIVVSVVVSKVLEDQNSSTYAEWASVGLVGIALARAVFLFAQWLRYNWRGTFTFSVQTKDGFAISMSYNNRTR